MALIIDTSTGTVLTAQHCVLLEDDALTDTEWEELDSMSDNDVSDLARERGKFISDLINPVTITLDRKTCAGLLGYLKDTVETIPITTLDPDPWQCVNEAIERIGGQLKD
jgi:hypothetical protein